MFSQEIKVKGKATRVRGATWTHDQVTKLFDVWSQPNIYKGLRYEKKKQDIFKSLAATLGRLGVPRTWRECRAKIKNLKADFRKAMDKKTSFRYYDQMWKIMNLDGSSKTPPSPASSGGQSSRHSHYESPGESDLEDDVCDSGQRPSRTHPSEGELSNPPNLPEPLPSTSTAAVASHPFEHDRHRQEMEYMSVTQNTPPRVHYPQYIDPPQQPDHFHHITPEKSRHQRHPDIYHEVDHESSPRSSTVITHVVSNVIEPVTTVVMPSSSRASIIRSLPHSPATLRVPEEFPDQQPIRLEFVIDNDNDNLVLQQPSPVTPEQQQQYSPISHIASPDPPETTETRQQFQMENIASPLPLVVTAHIPAPPTPSPPPPPRIPTPPSTRMQQTIPQKRQQRPPGVLQQQRKQKRPTPPQKEKSTTDQSKKRKLLVSLNKKTVETISTLLTDSSQSLLKELQDAEHRFISWEEEKRNEERKREEAMFSKLIAALKPSSSQETTTSSPPISKITDEESSSLITSFTNISKRLSDMVNDEIKATEETLRSWETKVQRQESRHTEKLFAMIINAIKTSSSGNDE